jgi:epoxyqueuosine reductase
VAPFALPSWETLERLGRQAGLDAVGVAGAHPFPEVRKTLEERKAVGLHGGMHFTYGNPLRSTDPGRLVPGARSLVVGALSYRRRGGSPPPPAPGRVAMYSWRDHYQPLREGLEVLASHLQDLGWAARVSVDANSMVDKAAAARAGIGWFGKNTLLLLAGRGSWFVLGSVVTDAPLVGNVPAGDAEAPGGCGSCTRCLTACPTGALVEPGILDARRCLAWLLQAPGPFPLEHREALGGRIYGCDDCQDVCPLNRTVDRRQPAPCAAAEDEVWVDLVELLRCSDEELLGRYGRWYIPQRRPRYLRRNALVALGNVGNGRDPAVRRVLAGALADPDPLLRAHAVWACGRLGLIDLLACLAGESNPEVRAELDAVSS